MKQYTLEECLKVQKEVDAGIKHNGKYMPWLAAVAEVIEMCEHLSLISTWKKQPDADMKQAFMELVDVFAFAMSMGIKENDVCTDFDYKIDFNVEELIKYAMQGFHSKLFGNVLYALEMLADGLFNKSDEDICYYYMGKQTLTKFRQANGYKDGTYTKMWGGREDNEYLTDLLEDGIEIKYIESNLKSNYERLVIAKAETE